MLQSLIELSKRNVYTLIQQEQNLFGEEPFFF